ncbi:MAG TPA: hypothetical protein VHY18_10645 [Solirubrobacteraceae bacterium]|nr:hypothetical protein [Solirubrobacteraceae bacterium]
MPATSTRAARCKTASSRCGASKGLRAGTYTLKLTTGAGKDEHTSTDAITIT